MARQEVVDQYQKRDRAARAVRAFNQMVPGLNSYVRTMTGNTGLMVRAHTFTATDGKFINIRPPLALAETADHDRLLCDKRDGYQLLCPACHKTEAVWSALYHEMSHITSGSLERHTGASITRVLLPALAEWDDKYAQPVKENISKIPSRNKIDCYAYAEQVHPHLINIVRATDDWMIESRAFVARTGVESMLYHTSQQLLERGVEQYDGSLVLWREQPTEIQLPVAVLMELHGWGLDNFGAETVQLVRSPRVAAIIERESGNGATATILDALALATELLGEFNRLGVYCIEPPDTTPDEGDDENDDPPAQTPPDDADDQAGSGSTDPDSTGTAAGSSADPDADASHQDSPSSSGGIPQGGDGDGGDTGEDRPSDDAPDSPESTSDAEPAAGDTPVPSASGDPNRPDDDADTDPNGGAAADQPDDGAHSDPAAVVPDSDTADPAPDDGDMEPGPEQAPDDSGHDDNDTAGSETGDEEPATDDSDYSGTEVSSTGNTGLTDDELDELSDAADTLGEIADADEPEIAPITPETLTPEPAAPPRVAPTPEQIRAAMDQMMGHDTADQIMNDGHGAQGIGTDLLDDAINQAEFFDAPSHEVGRQILHKGTDAYYGPATRGTGERDYRPIPEGELAPTIHRARRVFTDNSLDKHVNNLKKGKLSARNLGARGWSDDERLFRKKIRANKTDYEVVIGMDVSGSTNSRGRNSMIRAAGYGMAEILNRINVPFSMYAHTTAGTGGGGLNQEVYEVKETSAPWTAKTRELLSKLTASQGSLDGHNFEFYRKVLMRSRAQKKICIYFTDGSIPETNHTEERGIMIREAGLYKKMDIEALIVAVDIRLNNSYGFDQVHLNRNTDMAAVLKALEKKLTGGR